MLPVCEPHSHYVRVEAKLLGESDNDCRLWLRTLLIRPFEDILRNFEKHVSEEPAHQQCNSSSIVEEENPNQTILYFYGLV